MNRKLLSLMYISAVCTSVVIADSTWAADAVNPDKLQAQIDVLRQSVEALKSESGAFGWKDLFTILGGAAAGCAYPLWERRRSENRERLVRLDFDPYRDSLLEQIALLDTGIEHLNAGITDLLGSYVLSDIDTWEPDQLTDHRDQHLVSGFRNVSLAKITIDQPLSGKKETKNIHANCGLVNSHIDQANAHLTAFSKKLAGIDRWNEEGPSVREAYGGVNEDELRNNGKYKADLTAEHSGFITATDLIKPLLVSIRRELGEIEKLF